ncbi:probable glutamate receptor [Procambarus clarkii]|uniref:probable glutamate receptor n=1 Tax=Procambarus clarkii TaxID=6728 RepID=UPI003743ED06
MALTGSHLRVAADVWVPWVMFQDDQVGTPHSSGILIDFLNILASKLNFTYSVIRPPDGEWGRVLPNGSTTGMIGMCQRQEVDMALGPFSITYVRSKIIDNSVPLYVDNFGIFLPRPRLERDLAGFIKPFPWEVWTLLFVLLATTAVLGIFMKWLGELRRLPGTNDNNDFRSSWFIKTLLVETIVTSPKLTIGRVLEGSWLISALILGSAYQGVLTSMLAAPRIPVPVNSLQDLVHYGRLPWGVESGTALQQLLGDAKSGIYKKVSEGAFQITSLFIEKTHMKEKKFAILCDFFSMKQVMSEDYSKTGRCNYYIAQEVIISTSMAFVFPKGSVLVPHINKWLVMMKESGLVNRNLDELVSNATTCMVPPGKEFGVSTHVLSLADFIGVFLLLVAGMAKCVLTCAVISEFRSFTGAIILYSPPNEEMK